MNKKSSEMLKHFTTSKYFSHLPDMKQEKNQAYTTLILTLLALIFFGVFAISPTVSTIAQLQKQVEDSKFVNQKLEEKLNNLSILQQQYDQIETSLPVVFDAIPKSPKAAFFLGQPEVLAISSNVSMETIELNDVQLAKGPKAKIPNSAQSQTPKTVYNGYEFSVTSIGSYENIKNYISELTQFDRIITSESLDIQKPPSEKGLDSVTYFTGTDPNEEIQMNLSGKTYDMK